MENRKQQIIYFLHVFISGLGSRISSMVVAFIFIYRYGDQSVFYNLILFAIGVIPGAIFTRIYMKIISKIKDWRFLSLLDLLSAIFILLTFVFLENTIILLVLQFLLVLSKDITYLIDEGAFFIISKESKEEVNVIKRYGKISSMLSLFAPAIATLVIALVGYHYALITDFLSFVIGAILYLLLASSLEKFKIASDEEKQINRNETKTIFTYFDTRIKKIFLGATLVVVFITNLETPLQLNYFAITRNFTDFQIGILMAIFSIGMYISMYLYKYVNNVSINIILITMIVDAVCSFLFTATSSFILITIFYIVQGVAAMFMVITFKIMTQQLVEESNEFVLLQAVLKQYKSVSLIAAYGICMFLTLWLSDGVVFIRGLAMLEVASSIFLWILLSYKNINKVNNE